MKTNMKFENLLDEIIKSSKSKNTYKEIIDTIITFNGKINIQSGINSMDILNESFYDFCINENIKKLNGYDEGKFIKKYELGISKLGRLIIEKQGEMIIHRKVCDVYLNNNEIVKLNKIVKNKKRELDKLDNEIIDFYNTSGEEIKEMIDYVYYTINHMAPIIIYINDKLFSNFYQYNNLIRKSDTEKTYILDELKLKDLNKWSYEEKVFIYNMYWLIQSGGPFRVEEFNGMQLTSKKLHNYLDTKLTNYSHYVKENSEKKVVSIKEKSTKIKKLRNHMLTNVLFYRKINSIILNKEECYLENKNLLSTSIEDMSSKFKQILNNNYNYDVTKYNSVSDFFKEFVANSINRKNKCGNNYHELEKLLNDIVKIGTEETNSDIGMSRGIRDFKSLIKIKDKKDCSRAIKWDSSKFFCCVVPSNQFYKKMITKKMMLCTILKTVANRMNYNSWHYFAGNFPLDILKKNRDFYFPPKMADISSMTDYHHKGHIFANVSFSIRSPKNVRVNEKDYIALIDLRFSKNEGNEYTEKELKTALKYSSYLQLYYQVILDYLNNTEKQFKFKAFSNEWYDSHYTNREEIQ